MIPPSGFADNGNALSKQELLAGLAALSHGERSLHWPIHLRGVDGKIAQALNAVADNLRRLEAAAKEHRDTAWLEKNLARFHRRVHHQKNLPAMARAVLAQIGKVVPFERGVLYVNEETEKRSSLSLLASSPAQTHGLPKRVAMGEGLVGQCASDRKKILLTHVPARCIKLLVPDLKKSPVNIIVLPVEFEGELKAVIKLDGRRGFDTTQQVYLKEMCEILGMVLHKAKADASTQHLLRQSVSLARELQKQQTQLLNTNLELGKKARELADQKRELQNKNRELEQARQSLQDKATQLALASKFKSDFLANMSHELRTPLNSLLLLARQLLDNQERNLTERQLESARVIHASGQDLLRLINEVLDLSKIESGTVTLDVTEMSLWDLQQRMERGFRPIARANNLEFTLQLDPALPSIVNTDGKRLEQILKNLLSNAFKFTGRGSVKLEIRGTKQGWTPENTHLQRAPFVVAFSVSDTGIGISPDKQRIIFEAFQQGDGGTARKYGGTGLGLTISRELARLLGGEIHLSSTVGKGSVFTLYLPHRVPPIHHDECETANGTPDLFSGETRHDLDDRNSIQPGDRVFLCVEDDLDFAASLLSVARSGGFKGLIARRGESALEMVRRFSPAAITLDTTLPDVDGWKILERLKNSLDTRHIPIAVISEDKDCARGLKLAAAVFLIKPVKLCVLENAFERLQSCADSAKKKLLLVQPASAQGGKFSEWMDGNVETFSAPTARRALALLKSYHFDCMVLDLALSGNSGLQLLGKIAASGFVDLPIVVIRNRELTETKENNFSKHARRLLIKEVRSPERLLDAVTLFLHTPVARLPETARLALGKLHESNNVFAGKRALVVDDDIRNIFAMTSLLERYGMEIVSTENGPDALNLLRRGVRPDLALMDIMMPGFDGCTAIRTIRQMSPFKSLPIIAVTAKAMKEDRAKCLQAGASDYVAKPVDTEQLLATLRLWLSR